MVNAQSYMNTLAEEICQRMVSNFGNAAPTI